MTIDFSKESFSKRHLGSDANQIPEMLEVIGADSLDQLIDETVPPSIRLKRPLNLPAPLSEVDYLEELKRTASANKLFTSFIGQGYYDTLLPAEKCQAARGECQEAARGAPAD